jgi:hypothetical protein
MGKLQDTEININDYEKITKLGVYLLAQEVKKSPAHTSFQEAVLAMYQHIEQQIANAQKTTKKLIILSPTVSHATCEEDYENFLLRATYQTALVLYAKKNGKNLIIASELSPDDMEQIKTFNPHNSLDFNELLATYAEPLLAKLEPEHTIPADIGKKNDDQKWNISREGMSEREKAYINLANNNSQCDILYIPIGSDHINGNLPKELAKNPECTVIIDDYANPNMKKKGSPLFTAQQRISALSTTDYSFHELPSSNTILPSAQQPNNEIVPVNVRSRN